MQAPPWSQGASRSGAPSGHRKPGQGLHPRATRNAQGMRGELERRTSEAQAALPTWRLLLSAERPTTKRRSALEKATTVKEALSTQLEESRKALTEAQAACAQAELALAEAQAEENLRRHAAAAQPPLAPTLVTPTQPQAAIAPTEVMPVEEGVRALPETLDQQEQSKHDQTHHDLTLAFRPDACTQAHFSRWSSNVALEMFATPVHAPSKGAEACTVG